MKSYPKELREKIVAAHIHQKISIRICGHHIFCY